MKHFILFSLFWGTLAALFAQDAKITGHIYNDKNELMPYATVMLLENGKIINGTYSDEKGEYVFAALKAGTYSLKVSNLGFPDAIQNDLVLAEKETKNLDISLKPVAAKVEVVKMDKKVVMADSMSMAGEDDFSLSFRGARDGGAIAGDIGGESDGDGVPDAFDEVVVEEPSAVAYDKAPPPPPAVLKSDKSASIKASESEASWGIDEGEGALRSKSIPSAKGGTEAKDIRIKSGKIAPAGKTAEPAIAREDAASFSPVSPKKDEKPTDLKKEPAKAANAYTGKLTAGEVNDFAKWKMWKGLANDEFKIFQNDWKMVPQSRYVVQVENKQYHPLPNLKVELRSEEGEVIWTGRTDNTGKAELWADFFQLIPQAKGKPAIIRVYFDEKTQDLTQITPFAQGINYLTLDKNCNKNTQADIAFVVDATGSMGDEIAYLRADLSLIAGKLKDTLKGWDVNFASVFYQDKGDAYLTKSSPFSPNVAETQSFMANTPSGGGGDTPEAVESGLEEAIQKLKWNENASTRIVFLVLDAPSHSDVETLMKLQMQIRAAAHKGIRIIPVACSGINKSTEYLLRAMALATNGTYSFLTDDSGVGEAHIKPSTDNFKVEKFHQLAVRLVCQYTYQPECKPVETKEKPKTETVFKSTVIEKDEKKAQKDHDEVLGKNEENDKVWVVKKTPVWKYFPNPTQGNLTIEVEDNIGEIFLSDVSGKILARYEVKSKETLQIDLSAFANGIYFLRYEYEKDKWLNGKVILER